MKRRLILTSLFFSVTQLFAQSTDDIIRQHIEAVGGLDNWDKIETIIIDGASKNNQSEISIKKSFIKNKAYRSDITIESVKAGRSEKKYYIILNEDKGWSYLPENHFNATYALETAEVMQLKDELDYEDPFIHYEEKGREINLMNIENYHGQEYFKFQIHYKSDKKVYCYINSTTMMIDAIEPIDSATENIQRFLNYEKLPEGIVVAKKMINTIGEFTITSIQINTPLQQELFKPYEANQSNFQH